MNLARLYVDHFIVFSRRSWSESRIIQVLGLFMALMAPGTVAAVESATKEGDSIFSALLITLCIAFALAAFLIIGLVHWGRMQDHIGEMTLFCMKFLLQSQDNKERCASARALGEANDPGALLVLADLISDEEETEAVRKAAIEALREMGERVHRFKDVVADLESQVEQKNFIGVIDILIGNFEHGKKRYAQSAYVIGRHYMRLMLFVDAREWLAKAELRNRKSNLYGNRIKYWIGVCDARLLEEADSSFKAGDYHLAREHYAVLDHGLTERDRRKYAVYLRSACVYCMLQDYQNADQSLLQALEHNHETDLALTLVPLLRKMISAADNNVGSKGDEEKIANTLNEQANDIMDILIARSQEN